MKENYQTLSSSESPQQKEEETEKSDFCHQCFCWVFQVLVWGAIAFMVIAIITKKDSNSNMLLIAAGTLGFCYIVYLILEFTSSTCKYLSNKKSGSSMYREMQLIFQQRPTISFHCECWHMENIQYTERDNQGRIQYKTRMERRTTHIETYSFPYYSARDVSGLFYLNMDKAEAEKKAYIKLNLKEEINFADCISYHDYVVAKEAFWARNRFRDVHMDYSEKREIPGLKHHNLIQLTENEPACVNLCVFILFTLIPFAQIYSIFVNSYCCYQSYSIRKLVSTRYDLNAPQIVTQYNYAVLVPMLNLQTVQYTYQPSDYYYCDTSMEVNLPTEEELRAAEQYQSCIPNYQVTSCGGEMQAGVVQDCQGFVSYNNEPPAKYAQYQGALDSNMVNNQGNNSMQTNMQVNNGYQQNFMPNNMQVNAQMQPGMPNMQMNMNMGGMQQNMNMNVQNNMGYMGN